MALAIRDHERRRGDLRQSIELQTDAARAFDVLREVEKWPVWLSFLRSVKLLAPGPLTVGSEVAVRSAIPGDDEQLFEVDRLIDGHLLSLVGFYSIRRRFEFRVESRAAAARLVASIDYPSYGGAVGAIVDRFTARRRLSDGLAESLVHYKGLVEYSASAGVLADF